MTAATLQRPVASSPRPTARLQPRPLASGDLPRLSVPAARVLRMLNRPLATRPFTFDGRELAWTWGRQGNLPQQGVEVALRIGSRRYLCELDEGDVLLPGGVAGMESLSPAVRCALLAQRSQDAIVPLERCTGHAVTIDAVRAIEATARRIAGITFTVTEPATGRRATGTVTPVDASAFELLMDLCRQWPRRPAPLPDLPIFLRPCIGSSVLRHADLLQIAAGDLLFIQQPIAAGAGTGAALFAPGLKTSLFVGELDEDKVIDMDDAPDRQMRLDGDENTALDPEIRRFADVEMVLRFWLHEQRMTLTQIGDLQPGAVLSLQQPLSDAVVRIDVGGQTVGRGQLVAIGERLGVRITRFAVHAG